MPLCVNEKKFWMLMIPAIAVMAGVMFKNGGGPKQANIGKWSKMLGLILFIAGWLGVAYAVSLNGSSRFKSGMKMWLPVLAAIGVLVTVLVMMPTMEKHGGKLPTWAMILPVLFAGFWILLGWSVAMGKGSKALYFGLAASALVLLSMLISLPWQRKNCAVDMPGMALFALGWVALSVANAM